MQKIKTIFLLKVRRETRFRKSQQHYYPFREGYLHSRELYACLQGGPHSLPLFSDFLAESNTHPSPTGFHCTSQRFSLPSPPQIPGYNHNKAQQNSVNEISLEGCLISLPSCTVTCIYQGAPRSPCLLDCGQSRA